MQRNRLEAFSDGVIAIIITIMVLELKVPEGITLAALKPVFPQLLSYALSFIYIGIYWNNHHHLIHTVKKISGGLLWANLHLLFWLSLVPFVTAWMGENHFTTVPVALYGVIMLMAAIAYYILQQQILRTHGKDSLLARALGKDMKGKASPILYALAIGGSWFNPRIAEGIYVLVAFLWLIPDKRIQRVLDKES